MNGFNDILLKDLLFRLKEEIERSKDVIAMYLSQSGHREIVYPATTDLSGGIVGKDLIPAEFFEGFGIRRIISDAWHGKLSLSNQHFLETTKNRLIKYNWSEFENNFIIQDLRNLFRDARIIEFSNWVDVIDASDIWDNLRRDVIQPLNRNDFECIFSLTNTTRKPLSDVNEALDIMSDFGLYGRVSVLMGIEDAVQLWGRFNGLERAANSTPLSPANLNEMYQYLFDLIHIQHPKRHHRLVIFSADLVTVLSDDQNFQMTSMHCKYLQVSQYGRHFFVAGYTLGLLLQLETPCCIALGMATSQAALQSNRIPTVEILLSYLEKWMKYLVTDYNDHPTLA